MFQYSFSETIAHFFNPLFGILNYSSPIPVHVKVKPAVIGFGLNSGTRKIHDLLISRFFVYRRRFIIDFTKISILTNFNQKQ